MLRALPVLFLAPVLIAQSHSVELSRAGVSGYVRDHGRAVPNVQVMARSNADRQTTRTDSKGRYTFFSLTPGAYRITVVQQGLQTCIAGRVETQAGYHYQNIDVAAGKHC